jgi:lipopolysaccharide/colanic/teichoic acid biosynthesis glycosyltransferase
LALVIALVIQLQSRGPVFYHCTRLGKDGRPFKHHRFRTSIGSPYEKHWKRTQFGRLVGNLSLDEIPMLWNLLKGEVSVVGPRPEKPERMDLSDPDWQKVLSVKPGMMGLGLLTFLDRFNAASVKDRIQPEVYYVENQSFLLDVQILFKTLYYWLRMGHLKGRF